MKYDWMCAAYASAPTLSKQGRAHRAKYIRHWSKKAKPVCQIDIDHEMALAYDRRRDEIKRRLEQRKLERAYSEADRRKLKGDDWEVGDWVICTSKSECNNVLEVGAAYQIANLNKTIVGTAGVNVILDLNTDYDESAGWPRGLFQRVKGKTRKEALQNAFTGGLA